MKKSKILVLVTVFVLILSMAIGLISCKPKPEPTPPPPPIAEEASVSDVAEIIVDAIEKSYSYKGDSNLSWDFDAEFLFFDTNYRIATKGNIHRSIETQNAFEVGIYKEDEILLKIIADDEYLYFEYPNAKYRYVDFNFADLAMPSTVDGKENLDKYGGIVEIAIGQIFESAKVDKNDYILTANIPTVINKIVGILDDFNLGVDLSAITELAKLIPSNTTLTLKTVIKDGYLQSIGTTISADSDILTVNLNKAVISADLVLLITPLKNDASYIESKLFNYTLNGKFNMLTDTGRFTAKSVELDWELRVDINPFDVIRNGLFNTKDSLIHFKLYHQCDNDCGEYCETKVGPSKGALIDIAYAPESFGSSRVYLAVNTKWLIPTELIKSLNLPISIDGLLPEYLGTSINPEALLYLLGINDVLAPGNSVANAVENNFGIGFNPISLITNIIDVLGTVDINTNTFGVSIDKIINLIGVFDENIATTIEMFFAGIDDIQLTFDEVLHADQTNKTYKTYEEFMIISPELGELKRFDTDENHYDVLKKLIEFKTDANGNIRFNKNDAYDSDGKPLPVSKDELQDMLNTGVKYSYLDMYGKYYEGIAGIVEVIGLDWNSTEEQEITLITTLTDGSSLGNLMNLIQAFGLVENLPDIPGDVIKTKVKITDIIDVKFYQSGDENIIFNPEKEYYAKKDKLTFKFNLEVVYDATDENGNPYTKKMENILPTNAATYLYNYNSNDSAEIEWFDDFVLIYEAFGTTYEINVNMADNQNAVVDLNGRVGEIKLDINEKFTIAQRQNISYFNGEKDVAASIYIRNSNMLYFEVMDGMTVQYFNSGAEIVFTKPGVYDVAGHIRGAKVTNTFVVAEPSPIIPDYNVNGKVVDNETFEIIFTRPNQLGNGLEVTFDVYVKNESNEFVKLSKDQYELYEKNYKGEYIELSYDVFLNYVLPNGYSVFIKITDEAYISDSPENLVGKIDTFVKNSDIKISENICEINIYENISLTAGSSIETITTTEGAGKYIKLLPKLNGELYDGIQLKVQLSLFINGEEVVIGDNDISLVTHYVWMPGLILETPITMDKFFKQSELYLKINSSQVNNAAKFKITLIDTARNNKVITSIEN